MSHNLRSSSTRSKKKKRTDEPEATAESFVVLGDESKGRTEAPPVVSHLTPTGGGTAEISLSGDTRAPSKNEKVSKKVSAEFSESKHHSLEETPPEHNAAVLKAQRFLTAETMEALKGRVWMVTNDKIFTISDDLSLISELAAQWIESCIAPDNPVDVDSIYITACDGVREAMALAKLQGADRYVVIDNAAVASSPGVASHSEQLMPEAATMHFSPSSVKCVASSSVMKAFPSPTSSPLRVPTVGVRQEVAVQRNPYGLVSPSQASSGANAPDTPSKAAAAAVSAMKLSSGTKLDLSGISVDDAFVKNLVRQRMEESSESQGSGFQLLVSGSGVVKWNGKARFVGCFAVADESDGSVLWAFKAQAVALTFLVFSDSAPQLHDLRTVSGTMHATPIRRYENGSNIPKTVKGKKGGEFPVEAVAFFIDLSDKLRTPEEELGAVISKLHSVITNTDFKTVYLKCMKEIPKMAKLANSISSDDNPVWGSFKNCKLEVKMPLPLSTYMMDAEIGAAMAMLVDEGDQMKWTPEQRLIAYLDGKLPSSGGMVAVKSEL